jgi:hypothetical protein
VNLHALLQIARFFLRAPQDKAVEDLAEEFLKFAEYCANYPTMTELQNDIEHVLKLYNWGVTRDDKGNIATINPPTFPRGSSYEGLNIR